MVCKTNQLSILLLFILTFTLAILSQGILAIDYVVANNATQTPGGMVFANQIGEDHARKTMAKATKYIWQILEENTKSDRKSFDNVSLTIVPRLPPSTVAETINNHVEFSAFSLMPSKDVIKIKKVFDEVLFHEMTHVWQWNGNGQAKAGLLEGIADYVRLTAFRISVPPGAGARWDQGYVVTARFLMYCESLKKGFVAQLNKKMRENYSDKYFDELLGKSVDQLWSDYKAKYGGGN